MTLNEQQQRIVDKTDGLLRVDAGPGTGKTHTIVYRYINMVDKGADLNDILMVTFTKNAADEMAERMREELKDYAESLTDPEKKDRLLHELNDIRTSTFDSYCLRIVLNDPDAISAFFDIKETISRGAKLVANETLNKQHFERFYRTFIKEHGDGYRRGTDLPAVTADSIDDLYELIQKLMSRGIIPLKDYEWFSDGEKKLIGETHTMLTLLKNSNKGDYKGLKHDILTESESYAYPGDESKTFTEQELESAASDDRTRLFYFIHDVYFEYIRASIRDNRLTFALTALFAFAALYQSQYCRDINSVRYMMVDEFQDTNEMQMMICLMLLKEPNLCVVGDWKQGIYGFRFVSIENITEFSGKVERMASKLNRDGEDRVRFKVRSEDVTEISLEENYRSSALVLEKAFKALSIKATEKDPEPDTSAVTELRSVMDPQYRDHTAFELFQTGDEEDEMTCILNQITQYLYSGRYEIIEPSGPRAPRFGDITVLYRNSADCNSLYRFLSDRGIPAYLQGDMEIMSTRPGKLALAWLRYINDATDRRGMVSIMADAGMSKAQIDRMFREASEAVEAGEKFESALPGWLVDERSFLDKKRKRPNDLLTCMFAFHDIGEDNPAEADVAQAIISVLSASYSDSLMTIPDMIRLIEDDIEKGTKYNVDAILERDAVMIQTMHKSKGLEYPIVIVGDMRQSVMPSIQKDRGLFMYSDVTGLRMMKEYVENTADDGTTNCGIFKSWRSKIVKKAAGNDYSEERRLLFVALSRAKQYITMTCRGKMSSFMNAYLTGAALSQVPERLSGESREQECFSQPPEIPPYKKRRTNLGVHDLMVYVPGQKLIGEDSEKGLEYGRAVHEAAQQLALGRETDCDLPEVPNIRKVLDSFGEGASFIPERPCALPVGNVTLRGVIDLLVDMGDRLEVHDWKTDTDARNMDSYRLQLSVYYHAVHGATGLPVECHLDFVSLGESVKVEPMSLEEIAGHVDRYYKKDSGTSRGNGSGTIGA